MQTGSLDALATRIDTEAIVGLANDLKQNFSRIAQACTEDSREFV